MRLCVFARSFLRDRFTSLAAAQHCCHDLPTTLLLVPTERHVESALAAAEHVPLRPRTLRAFVRDALDVLAPHLVWATPPTTRLCAYLALQRDPIAGIPPPDEPAQRVTFADAVDSALGELRRAGTTPRQLRAAGGGQALFLAEMMERADSTLSAADLSDPRSAGFELARRLQAQSGSADDIDLTSTKILGFAGWEADDLAWIEALHVRSRRRGGRGVTVVLPRSGGYLEEAIAPIGDTLERRWASLVDAPEIEWQPHRLLPPDGMITARNPEGEARAVVAEVLAALERGVAPERIVIAVPDLSEERLEPLRAVLADARVPFCEPRGPAAATLPEGKAALALLEMAMGPVTREHMIEILRAPGLDLAFAGWIEKGGDPDAAGRATALAHRLREVPVEIDRSGGLLLEGLSALVHDRPDEAWMPRVLERILQSVHWLGAGSTRRDLVRRFIALLDRTQLGSPSAREIETTLTRERRDRPRNVAAARGAAELPAAAAQSAALRAMGEGATAVRALRQAARAIESAAAALRCDTRPATIAEFASEMERAAQSSGAGSGRAGARTCAVRIARPLELCGLSCDMLLVTGLKADAYGASDEGGRLLGERLRADLPAPCRPPSAREMEIVRRAELAWALAGAERTVLTWSAGDADEPDIPHPLLLRAQADGARHRQEPASRASRSACRTDPRSADIVTLACGARPAPEVAERVRIERERAAFFLDPRRPAGTFTGRMDVADPAARMHLRAAVGGDSPEHPIAVTAIERAAGCAFAGYARRVLRVRRSEDQLEAADHRERGNLVHKALWAAFDAARDAGGRQKPRHALLAAKGAAENALGLSGRISPLRREALLHAVADALTLVARWLEREDPLTFLLAERRFGKDDPPPWQPLQIPPRTGDETSLYIEGQIDRIDRTTDGRTARVVDYKTGKIPSDNDHGRLALQLPLYAAVAARALGAGDTRAQYFSVRLRGVIEEWPPGVEKQCEIAARSAEASETARRVVLGLWRGEVEPRPTRSSLCVRCDARDVCRRPAVVPEESPED